MGVEPTDFGVCIIREKAPPDRRWLQRNFLAARLLLAGHAAFAIAVSETSILIPWTT